MTVNGSNEAVSLLAQHEGPALYSAGQAILKGLLEAEPAVSIVAGPAGGPFETLFRVARQAKAAELLRKHDLVLEATPGASRALTLARHAARSGRNAVALVPNEPLSRSVPILRAAAGEVLPQGGRMCLLLEDHPDSSPETCPRRMAAALKLTCIEPVDIGQLRDGIETALRLSRAGNSPIGLIVHNSILRGGDTIDARPNRVIESVEAMLARRRRRRRQRFAESGDVLRVVRRLELNRLESLPSPGERVPVGFITVGPADAALRHLTYAHPRMSRVPILQLGAVHPIDDVAVFRLLERCERVVVLEPRPGVIEAAVLEIGEAMRRQGRSVAAVWGRLLPAGDDGEPPAMGPDDAVHPSLLRARIGHLLRSVRSSGRASSVSPPPVARPTNTPPRGATIGPAAALAAVRRIAADVDQWLRERRAPEEEEKEVVAPTALAIDGSLPSAAPPRVVTVETWTGVSFRREGLAALVQAARAALPWMFIICDLGSENGGDLHRLARGGIPAQVADRVAIESVNLADRARLVECMRESALADRLTIIIVADGPPARFDVTAIERALTEVDRLGFEPRQRVTWPADRACEVRRPPDEELLEPRGGPETEAVHSAVRVDRLPPRGRGRFRFRARPIVEQVEVIRTRPPAQRWQRDPSAPRLPLPEIIHRRAPLWRAHLAGYRAESPGLATRVLTDAGRRMGYTVRWAHDPTAIGAGRRAWAQVLFMHPRSGETPPPLTARTPVGEADLLLGLDGPETVRALAADAALCVAQGQQTYAVANLGLFRDEADTEQARAVREELRRLLRQLTRLQPRLTEDFAEACRSWFHTDRVVDLAMLGSAFQSGLIPVTVDALEAALAEVEAAGYGRAIETFQLGRRLALDRRLFSRPPDDQEGDTNRVARRLVHLGGRRRRGSAARARRRRELLQRSLAAMPGLSETDAGRQAARDFLIALARCWRWGSIELAERYAQLITALYRVDRGDTGRALTRHAVLPLASAMLIRDPIFIASMLTSPEHHRRTRQALNVKRAREDELVRRYLTRVELIAFHRRYRVDIRTSDWPARLAASLRRVVPARWRGTRRERDQREYIVDLTERAIRGARDGYDHYQTAFARLHQQALENRLRGMALSEMKMLAEPVAASSS
ncbi:MAG: hypothetical protein SYC29_12855 [Planctomycetota bacterium]|nr:hypothetical protein [Planctomycetota bacterium]